MAYDVQFEQVLTRALAAVRASVARARLGDEMRRLVGTVWPVLRAQRVVARAPSVTAACTTV